MLCSVQQKIELCEQRLVWIVLHFESSFISIHLPLHHVDSSNMFILLFEMPSWVLYSLNYSTCNFWSWLSMFGFLFVFVDRLVMGLLGSFIFSSECCLVLSFEGISEYTILCASELHYLGGDTTLKAGFFCFWQREIPEHKWTFVLKIAELYGDLMYILVIVIIIILLLLRIAEYCLVI